MEKPNILWRISLLCKLIIGGAKILHEKVFVCTVLLVGAGDHMPG